MKISAFCLSLAVCGCGGGDAGDAPTVYPAGGTVKKSDGSAVTGGDVSFRPQDGAGPTVSGRIGPNGDFSLKTITAGGAVVDGAPPGKYLVSIVPDFSQDQAAAAGPPPKPVQLPTPYEVKEAGENKFDLIAP